MSKPRNSREAAYGPLQRKTFRAAVVRELCDDIPSLGELTSTAIAERLEELVEQYFPKTERLRMGQILWPAVDQAETAGYGKRIEETRLKPVMLEAIGRQDIEDYLKGVAGKTIRQKVTLRLFRQAKEQAGVLSSVDVAAIMRLSPGTISRYVREHEKESGEVVPRRGTVHDMGPSVTHKREICRRVILQGGSIEETARQTNHSPEAVSRYVQDYRRVVACMKAGMSIEQTAYATAMSLRLVEEYQALVREGGAQRPDEREEVW
jgi:transposase-like protein